jgi:hypothetical protein
MTEILQIKGIEHPPAVTTTGEAFQKAPESKKKHDE